MENHTQTLNKYVSCLEKERGKERVRIFIDKETNRKCWGIVNHYPLECNVLME